MYDDDFLDRLLNSSGDDLDRLIQHDKELRKHRPNDDVEVDMSDIERILNGTTPTEVVSVRSFPTEPPDDYFKAIYEQLTVDYPIDRPSAVKLHAQRERILTMAIRFALVVLGVVGIVWLITVL